MHLILRTNEPLNLVLHDLAGVLNVLDEGAAVDAGDFFVHHFLPPANLQFVLLLLFPCVNVLQLRCTRKSPLAYLLIHHGSLVRDRFVFPNLLVYL